MSVKCDNISVIIRDVTDICVCCLKRDVDFVNLSTCKHSGFFSQVVQYRAPCPLKLVCRPCHGMLVKMMAFKKQVEDSIVWLNNKWQNSQVIAANDKKPTLNLKRSTVKIFYTADSPSQSIGYIEIEIKNELGDQQTNEDAEIWTAEQPLADPWTPLANEETLPAPPELDLAVEIKTDPDIFFDLDENLPLSHSQIKSTRNQDVGTLDGQTSSVFCKTLSALQTKTLTNKPVKTPLLEPTAPVDIYEGKVRTITLTREEFLQEKESERAKEAFTRLPYKCNDCVVGFEHEVTLRDHMKKRHTKIESSFVCELCKSVLGTENSFKSHVGRHFRRYECCACCKRYATMSASVAHYKAKHGTIDTIYECDDCDFTTDKHSEYRRHRRQHKDKPKCGECGKEYIDAFGLKTHVLSNRKYRYHRSKHKEMPQCTLCGKLFANNSGLKFHMLTQHKNMKPRYNCAHEGCDKSFKTKTGLRAHIAGVHEEPSPVYCETCRLQFKCSVTLKAHLKMHSAHVSKEQWKFICDECGKKFLRKVLLRQHIDFVHLQSNTHQCQQCKKVFKSSKFLRRHIEYVHEKKRPPKNKICDHCGKGFTTLQILRTHVRTHTGERPLPCAKCRATFAHPAALYTHNKLVHNKTAG